MRIEIDQSGKLENTNISTVVGFSNGKTKSIIISSREKIRLQKYFRDIGKRKAYIYFSFATMIFLLLKDEYKIDEIIIDTEYPGQGHLIKSHLLQLFSSRKNRVSKDQIYFSQIGHKSYAHHVSVGSFRLKRATIRIKASDVIKLMPKQKSGI